MDTNNADTMRYISALPCSHVIHELICCNYICLNLTVFSMFDLPIKHSTYDSKTKQQSHIIFKTYDI